MDNFLEYITDIRGLLNLVHTAISTDEISNALENIEEVINLLEDLSIELKLNEIDKYQEP